MFFHEATSVSVNSDVTAESDGKSGQHVCTTRRGLVGFCPAMLLQLLTVCPEGCEETGFLDQERKPPGPARGEKHQDLQNLEKPIKNNQKE